jgi:D-alanine-D-alanine ligase
LNDRLHIVVMSGGPSAEREVSLRSGVAVTRALRAQGHQVTDLDPIDDDWRLPEGTDVVCIMLHGTYGEDGQVQAHLDQLDVPYTGTGSEASRVAFDKALTKECLHKAGLATPAWSVVDSPNAVRPAELEPPLVLKPVRQGSSVGLQFMESADQWGEALIEVLKHDEQVLVEPRVIGREVTVAILDDQPLPVVEMRPKQGAYDYHNKYTAGATDYFCPADFDAATTKVIQSLGLAAHRALGVRDYGRVDIMVGIDGTPTVLEVNTLPGMTETSLLPKAAAAAGIDFASLCGHIVRLAMIRAAKLGSLVVN